MNNINLTNNSDQFLRKAERSKEYPAYSDATLDYKSKSRPNKRGSHFTNECQGTSLLRAMEWARTITDARLTPRQFRVFCARIRGYSWSEISELFGHTKQAALKIFRQAIRKFRRTLRESKFHGLYQIYRSEVTRFAPSRCTR